MNWGNRGVRRAAEVFLSAVMLVSSTPAIEPPEFSETQLREWLKSNRIRDLRAATAMIRAYPQESLFCLPLVASRANHPELTPTLEFLADQADKLTLEALVSRPETQQKSLLARVIATKPEADDAIRGGMAARASASRAVSGESTSSNTTMDHAIPVRMPVRDESQFLGRWSHSVQRRRPPLLD